MSPARVHGAGALVVLLGGLAVAFSFCVFATDGHDFVLKEFRRGPLVLPTLCDLVAAVASLGSRRSLWRRLGAVCALGSVAAVLILRHGVGIDASGLELFEGGTVAIAAGTCARLGPRRVATPRPADRGSG